MWLNILGVFGDGKVDGFHLRSLLGVIEGIPTHFSRRREYYKVAQGKCVGTPFITPTKRRKWNTSTSQFQSPMLPAEEDLFFSEECRPKQIPFWDNIVF